MSRWRRFWGILFLLPIALCCMGQKGEETPDFAAISNESQRKQAFFCYIAPKVEEVNARVSAQRKRLEKIRAQQAQGEAVGESGQRFVKKMAADYKVKASSVDSSVVDELLGRVDGVPVSLALAQAANESAWGTSRFARDGHNYFGQWCYEKNCGLVPRKRPQGATYEVRKFEDTEQSVAAFVHNLNTNRTYALFRSLRSKGREKGKGASGLAVAEGLKHYSARGSDYVKTLRVMIRTDDLEVFETRSGMEKVCRVQGAAASQQDGAQGRASKG